MRHITLVTLLLFYVAYIVYDAAREADSNFWDFRVYYFSADAEDPYNADELTQLHGDSDKQFAYKYAPVTLFLFRPFSYLDYSVALTIFMVISLIGAGLMITIWKRLFVPDRDPWFVVFLILGCNAAFYTAFKSGNVVMILACLIWIAFYAFLNRRYNWFVVLILLASAIKITPILFLIILIFPGIRKYKHMLIGLTVFLLYGLLNFLMYPEMTTAFINSSRGVLTEGGIINPSLLNFWRELTELPLKRTFDPTVARAGGYAFYGLSVLAVAYLTVKRIGKDPLMNLGLVLLATTLVLPRFKDYDFILLLPVIFYTIRNVRVNSFYPLLFCFILSTVYVSLPGVRFGYQVMWNYYPMLVALISWVILMKTDSRVEIDANK